MKSKIRSLVKLVMLFCVTLLMFNCQNEESSSNQTQNKIQTVTMDEAKNFLVHSENNSLAKSTSNKLENLEFNKIAQEKINGTDQLLTVIPFATNSGFENERILLLKIDNEIKSVIVSMYPDENSVKGSFTGKLFAYSLGGNFINGFRVEDGIIVGKYVENNVSLKTNTENATVPTLTGKSAVELSGVTVYQKKTVHALDMFGVDGIFNDFDSGSTYYSWDVGDGGSNGKTNNSEDVYPDCTSFNFVKIAGVPWQEAAVKNIHFTIEIIQSITPLITSSETIFLPQAVSFQMPTKTKVGNTNITSGTAASVTAKAIDIAMKETREYYKAVPATELMVTQFFKKALKDTFELMTPGSRLQINPVSTVSPTEYKSNWFFPGNCN